MDKKIIKYFFILLTLVLFTKEATAQQTIITGVVKDLNSGAPIPFATIIFKNGRGTVTDSAGKYKLVGANQIASIKISYVGYKTITKNIQVGKSQVIDFIMEVDPLLSNNVTVSTNKRAPYKNKNNPAVDLIKRVIANKPLNRPDSYDYIQYEEYDKVELSLSKIPEKITNSKLLKKYQFLFDNRDTQKVIGKTLIPIYLEERLSTHYFRKSPEKTKDILLAQKRVNFGDYVDNDGVSTYLNRLVMDVNIYENNIPLFTHEFLSPIADVAPTFYMYYIRDTITDANGQKLVKLYFTPRNTNDLLFRGTMYITLDGNYGVQKMTMFISKNANINFVRELNIDLDFEQGSDSRYHLIKSTAFTEAALTKNSKGGIFGGRTVSYKNYTINKALPDSVYTGPSLVVKADAANYTDAFWNSSRHDTLTKAESKVYSNIDSLEKMPSFRRTMAVVTLLVAGYTAIGPFDIGPAATFYSFNPVEGFRLRVGGRTTPKLSKRIYFEGYGAYGFKDERWKYYGGATYSLNNQSIYAFPMHFVRASYQQETKIPGQDLEFVSEDNIFLSLKRGLNDKWTYNKYFRIDYVHELPSRLSYTIGFRNWKHAAAGGLVYQTVKNGQTVVVPEVNTSEITGQIRWAPHEQFFQGKVYRVAMVNKYPILTLNYTAGLKGVMGSNYNYQKVSFTFDKRFYLSQLGFTDINFEVGQMFGKIPYPLLSIPRANQTYAYQLNSYNLMNFQEFVSDRYASLFVEHYFNGLIFNRIPLFKKLKLREQLAARVIYGSLRDENDPSKNPDLIAFQNYNGAVTSFSLNQGPYFEGSVGIGNIFKFLRVDLVKRFTYTNNPYITKLGIRTRFRFDF